jgi:hypothetical protein
MLAVAHHDTLDGLPSWTKSLLYCRTIVSVLVQIGKYLVLVCASLVIIFCCYFALSIVLWNDNGWDVISLSMIVT